MVKIGLLPKRYHATRWICLREKKKRKAIDLYGKLGSEEGHNTRAQRKQGMSEGGVGRFSRHWCLFLRGEFIRPARTGTVVIHRRFRRALVISNAESAIYASGARMGGVAPSAVPLAPAPFYAACTHASMRPLFTPLSSSLSSSRRSFPSTLCRPAFSRWIGVRAVIPAKYWWCVALFIATSPLSRQQGR